VKSCIFQHALLVYFTQLLFIRCYAIGWSIKHWRQSSVCAWP